MSDPQTTPESLLVRMEEAVHIVFGFMTVWKEIAEALQEGATFDVSNFDEMEASLKEVQETLDDYKKYKEAT